MTYTSDDMYLCLSPSDIFYLTGVMTHEGGEVMILLQKNKAERIKQKEGIVLCDPRTSGLFNASQFEIVGSRELW